MVSQLENVVKRLGNFPITVGCDEIKDSLVDVYQRYIEKGSEVNRIDRINEVKLLRDAYLVALSKEHPQKNIYDLRTMTDDSLMKISKDADEAFRLSEKNDDSMNVKDNIFLTKYNPISQFYQEATCYKEY